MLPPPPPETEDFETQIQQAAEANDAMQFEQVAGQVLAEPEGETNLANVFQSLISDGETENLLTLLSQVVEEEAPPPEEMPPPEEQPPPEEMPPPEQPQQPPPEGAKRRLAQAEVDPQQISQAWSLALQHLIAVEETDAAAEAIALTLSDAGGEQLATTTGQELESMVAEVGCEQPPVTAVFQELRDLLEEEEGQEEEMPPPEGEAEIQPQILQQNLQEFPSLQQCYQQVAGEEAPEQPPVEQPPPEEMPPPEEQPPPEEMPPPEEQPPPQQP